MNGIAPHFGGITKVGDITGIGKLETTTLSVSAGATMNGIDNNFGGITKVGDITGVGKLRPPR